MAVSDNLTEGFTTSAFNSMEFGQVAPMLTPEDVAWAESCLIRDVEILDSGWNSMRDALLETLSAQHESSEPEEDEFSKGNEMEISHSIEESDISTAVNNKVAERSSGNKMTRPRTDDFWSKYSIEDAFVPSYNNSLRDLGISEDIFRIWDLGIPPEEDDFVKQLNGAIAESSLEPTTSVSDHSLAGKGSNGESLGELISGIAHLSLGPNFG